MWHSLHMFSRERRRESLVLLALLLATLTCSGVDNIEVEATGETTVESSLVGELVGELSFLGFEGIDISESQEFKNQGYTKDQVDSVRLQRFVLSVKAPEDGDFDFLARVSFYAEAEGLPRKEIARLDPVPEGQSEIEMELLDAELRDYAVAESMTITTEATGSAPERDTTIAARVVLDVDVNVAGSLGCAVAPLSN